MEMGLGGLWELVMDSEACRAAVLGIVKSWTRLNNWTELMVSFITVTLNQFYSNCQEGKLISGFDA